MSPANQAGGGAAKKDGNWTHVTNSPLSPTEILSRVRKEDGEMLIQGRTISFGVICFRGYYPDTPYKANQDDYAVLSPAKYGHADKAMFAVFDGHGHVGEKCARFAMTQLPTAICAVSDKFTADAPIKSNISKTFVEVNKKMHAAGDIDDTLSGTTAVMSIIMGNTVWVANVGDSRCIIVKEENGNLVPKALSTDQTPYRRDERARVRKSGARVLNMDQLEGLEAIHDDWDMSLGDEVDEGGDPPRIWSQDGAYPGTAFTRSFGDSIAEELGVFAEPEILKYEMTKDDKFMIVASDGVWEFITNKDVCDIAKKADDPQEAACLLWKAAYKEWITKEVRTDDISVIVVDVSGYFAAGGDKGEVAEREVKVGKKGTAGTRRGSLGPTEKK
jgi:serine/threonine protein phosphatase PrpC